MRKKVRRIFCVFEKKKGEEVTKGGIKTRHPLPFSGTATGGLGPPLPSAGL
jgi:hypothetical protein